MRTALVSECLGRTQQPSAIAGHSGGLGELDLPNALPNEGNNAPLAPKDNQKYYPHGRPGETPSEPLAQLGGQSAAASEREASWQSLLTAPLND
jgi:hypothetical protein